MEALLTQPVVQAAASILGRDQVRLVGGAVRDAVSGTSTPQDLDMATTLPPSVVMERLQAHNLNCIPVGLKHGTVTLILGKQHLEITTLRRDVETDGRHARVSFTQNWQQDAARRDFTFNALFLDMQGRLHDYFEGEKHLKAGEIHFIGDARTRLEEDYLRLLRFFRFYAQYGQQTPDPKLETVLQQAALHMKTLSGERVRKEFWLLLPHPRARPALVLMNKLTIDRNLFGSCFTFTFFDRLVRAEVQHETLSGCDPLRRLAALYSCQGDILGHLGNRLNLGNQEKRRFSRIRSDRKIEVMDDKLEEALYCHSQQTLIDQTLLFYPTPPYSDEYEPDLAQRLKTISGWIKPVFPLTGRDLIDHGFKPGPLLGYCKRQLEKSWVNSGFSLKKRDLLKMIQK